MQTQKVQARIFGNAAVLNRITVFIPQGNFDPAEIETISRRPNDRFDPFGPLVQFFDNFAVKAIFHLIL